MEGCGRIIGNDVWIDLRQDGRFYVRHGMKGYLDLRLIRKAFAVDSIGNTRPIAVDISKNSYGEFLLNFNNDGIYTVVIEYDCGVNSKNETISNRDVYHVYGFAKAYFIVGDLERRPSSVGLDLEIIPEVIKKFREGERVGVQLLSKNKPVRGEIKVRCGKKLVVIFDEDYAEINLGKGANVISAKVIDGKKLMLSTLTIMAY